MKTTIIGLVIAIILAIMMAACGQTPAENEEIMSCEEYCETQPRIQCVGYPEISGTYPDCECGWVCEDQEEESGELLEVPESLIEVEEESKVYSSDRMFWTSIQGKTIDETSAVTYFSGDDNTPADKVILGGDGLAEVERAEVWIQATGENPRLKSIMHKVEDGFDSPLRGHDAGLLTFKLFRSDDSEIPNDLEIVIVPE